MSSDPRIRSFISVAIMAAGVFGARAAMHSDLDDGMKQIVLGISLAVLFLGFILHFALVRCPHCGAWIRRPYGDYCRYCGKKYSEEDDNYNEDDYNIPGSGSWF